jgi:hypothetical protein
MLSKSSLLYLTGRSLSEIHTGSIALATEAALAETIGEIFTREVHEQTELMFCFSHRLCKDYGTGIGRNS